MQTFTVSIFALESTVCVAATNSGYTPTVAHDCVPLSADSSTVLDSAELRPGVATLLDQFMISELTFQGGSCSMISVNSATSSVSVSCLAA